MPHIPPYLTEYFTIRRLTGNQYLALCEMMRIREVHLMVVYAKDGSPGMWGAEGIKRPGFSVRQAIVERLKLGQPADEGHPAPVRHGWRPTELSDRQKISIFAK